MKKPRDKARAMLRKKLLAQLALQVSVACDSHTEKDVTATNEKLDAILRTTLRLLSLTQLSVKKKEELGVIFDHCPYDRDDMEVNVDGDMLWLKGFFDISLLKKYITWVVEKHEDDIIEVVGRAENATHTWSEVFNERST